MGRGFARISFWVLNQAGLVATLSGCSIIAVLAAVSGYLAKHTAWIASHGPIAWWGVTLAAACVGLLLIIGVAHLRYKWVMASAVNKWKENVHNINPLDEEFKQKRIAVSDLVAPFTSVIEGKTFIECEIIGPAAIGVIASRPGSGGMSGCIMIGTCGAVIKNDVFVPTGVLFKDCHFLRCKIASAIILVPEHSAEHMFKSLPGLDWITPGYPTTPRSALHPIPAPPASPAGTSPQKFP